LQVEAMGLKGPIKTPIALLEMGKTAQIILDLSFPDPPVTFTLVKGSGPVHIVGHNLLGTYLSYSRKSVSPWYVFPHSYKCITITFTTYN